MIVLDEHLLHPRIKEGIERWYQGKVCPITELRPGTVIYDDAITSLLHRVPDPSFVTLNVRDFWRKVKPDKKFFVACLQVRDREDERVPPLLQRLLSLGTFPTKRGRMGKIALVGNKEVSYYSTESWVVRSVNW